MLRVSDSSSSGRSRSRCSSRKDLTNFVFVLPRPKISSSNIEKAKTKFSSESEWPNGRPMDVFRWMSVGSTRVFDAADAFLKSLLIKFKTILRFRSAHFVGVVAVVLSSRIRSTINHNSLYTPNVSRKRARMNGSVSAFFPSPSLPQFLSCSLLFTLFLFASATCRRNFVGHKRRRWKKNNFTFFLHSFDRRFVFHSFVNFLFAFVCVRFLLLLFFDITILFQFVFTLALRGSD